MDTSGFHFATPLWLLALPLPLLLWWLPRSRGQAQDRRRLERYADPHLLPLLMLGTAEESRARRRLVVWTALWVLGVLAMSGPRFGYTDVRLYQPNDALVVLLDLSRSMQAQDVRPSRLSRAKQEVADLVSLKEDLRVGLIGFASVSHVVAPVTDDAETLRHLLPALSTELIRWQGSRVGGALERARSLLASQPPGGARALLLVTDGDLAEPELEAQVRDLRAQGMRLHVLGVGTTEGAQVPTRDGGWVLDARGAPVISRLEEGALRALAGAGGGLYQRSDFRDGDVRAVLDAVRAAASPGAAREGTRRVWNERYYLPLAALMALLLYWWHGCAGARRGEAKPG